MIRADVKILSRPHHANELDQVVPAERDATLSGREVRCRDVYEYSAASTTASLDVIVAHDDDEVVQVVVAPKTFCARPVGVGYGAIVVRVTGSVAPTVGWTNCLQR
ncbi:protein of unknown function [Candidatus Filomicrobium marinum]|uniref:Uncharacterized protein n=1 Tax=Candidatus Filomicrobium marinum TaxID=1608628 RepID=A0A0D6JC96_9HYPH|nr:protein of unknown function [Candidatus Filomicrobium marinum]CPR16948.1 protein of unknown function [Candidatus Filomicrobium marinum]